jgi:hypothetical protein
MLNTSNLHSIDHIHKQPIPKVKSVNLSQLAPNTYTTVRTRVLIVKSKVKEDQLGKRSYIFGICEDQKSRLPFLCYKPYPNFFHNGVFEFKDAYVHQFEDKSILLILTELSQIDYLINEDPKRYIWNPQIGDIKRPTGTCHVTLEGTLSQISSSSGLVQRCEDCGRLTFDAQCPNNHKEKLFWAFRISGKLSDHSGSINVVFPQQLACKLVGRTVSEILELAEGGAPHFDLAAESYSIHIPEAIELGEAYANTPDDFRSAHSPVIVDPNDSKIIYPNDLRPKETFANEVKRLNLSKVEDRRDLARVAERLIEIKIQKLTRLPKINGILLTETPLSVYGAENAKLYVGVRVKTNVTSLSELVVQVLPSAEIYESVHEYVQYRRQRGASANAIRNSILNYRRNVAFAPRGELAAAVNLKFMKAGEFKVPLYDLTLPEFWKKIHDVDVAPEETPLVVTKPYRLNLELTFPPSCVFFDKQSIRTSYGIRSLIDKRRRNASTETRRIVEGVLEDFSIGTFKLPKPFDVKRQVDAKEVLLTDLRERLLGRWVRATGSVVEAEKHWYFIPRTVELRL